jgi:hypothetical protein
MELTNKMSDNNKDYMQELEELRQMLKDHLPMIKAMAELLDLLNKSYVHRYVEIIETSQWGKDCGYAGKAKQLFLAMQEPKISEKIEEIYHTFLQEKK